MSAVEILGVTTAPLGLLVVQPTTFCNIDCRYCYLGQRSEKHRMSAATISAATRFVRDIPLRDRHLDVVWHAGEPLTLPIAFYETAFEVMRTEAAPIQIKHYIQTNATLIDDKWCALFRQWSVHVGVSIDGPKAINDLHRVDRAGGGTYDKAIRGIGRLREHAIPFTAIGVLTRDSLRAADDIWCFFESLGATQVAFNVDEQEGTNQSSSFLDSDIGKFKHFVRTIAQYRRGIPSFRMRELDGMRAHLCAPPGSAIERADLLPGAIINIDYEGNVTTFSPELLGVEHEKYGKFNWGNVHYHGWKDILVNPSFQRTHDDIKIGIERCRETCAYFSVCGGGNPSNKLSELDTFTGTETQYCRLHIQSYADVVLEELEQELSNIATVENPLRTDSSSDQGDIRVLTEVDLYLTGAGIAFPEHLTIETIEILSTCKRICTNLQERDLEGLPQDLREKCISLWSLYQDRRVRTENYNDVFNAIVAMAEIETPLAWLTPGHPVIFDSVTAALLNEGKKRGWNIQVVPAISSIDTMLAELGYDPAHGMLIHECTGLVQRRVSIDRTIAAMLLQPAVFNVNFAIIRPGSMEPDLSPLRDYICQFHSPEHKCAFIRSASKIGERDLVTWASLRDMASIPYDRVAGSTLFIPPA